MADKEKIFVDGMIIKRKQGAPSFVKCSLSFKMVDFIAFARKHQNDGWINVDIKMSKGNKLYAELDTWKPKSQTDEDWDDVPNEEPQYDPENDEPVDDGIPF